MKTNQQPDEKETKFSSKILKQKEHNRKSEWLNNMEKEFQRLKGGSEVDIDQQSLRATPKKVLN